MNTWTRYALAAACLAATTACGNTERPALEGAWKQGRPDGQWTWSYANGKPRRIESFRDGRRTGTCTEYFPNGKKSRQQEWENGRQHGKSVSWYANGKKEYEGQWQQGRMAGRWTFWGRDGNKAREEVWEPNGTSVRTFLDAEGNVTRKVAYKGHLSFGMERKLWEEGYAGGKPAWRQEYKMGRPAGKRQERQ